MNKAEFIDAVYRQIPLRKEDGKAVIPYNTVELVIDTAFDIMKSNLSSGEGLNFRGLFKTKYHHKNGRIGRNPKTGEEFPIFARTVCRLQLSQEIIDEVAEL